MSVEDVERAEELSKAAKGISKKEARGSFKLWFAVLGGPLAWTGHLGINYSLEEWFACSKSAEHVGEIFGVRAETLSLLVNTVMLAVALASGLVAYSCWKQLKNATGDEGTERARWMAFAGMVEGALFLGIILLGFLPGLIIGVCETTP